MVNSSLAPLVTLSSVLSIVPDFAVDLPLAGVANCIWRATEWCFNKIKEDIFINES